MKTAPPVTWPAPAKLNLFLHVTGRRDDGFHELQTVFQFLDYGDYVRFEPDDSGQVVLSGGLPDIPPGQDLILRAAAALAMHTGCRRGAHIRLEKNLPAGGGLGGGSSDAATTLVALNILWDLQLEVDELAELGLQLGTDVPVFVRGFAAWAEGVGERLTPMDSLEEPWYLVVNPQIHVSTAQIFADPQLTRNASSLRIPAFRAELGVNHLQAVVTRQYPEVGKAVNWLASHRPARMTGSGACIFAACESRAQAESIREQIPLPWTGFVAQGCNRSPLYRCLGQ